jgi:hypothetical protein
MLHRKQHNCLRDQVLADLDQLKREALMAEDRRSFESEENFRGASVVGIILKYVRLSDGSTVN